MQRIQLSKNSTSNTNCFHILLFVLFFSLYVTACSDKTNENRKNTRIKTKTEKNLLKEANILAAQDKTNSALALYRKALVTDSITKDPAKYAEVLARASRILVMKGDFEEADNLTSKCLKAWNNPLLTGNDRAEVLVCLDDLGQAYLEKARGKNETDCLEHAIDLLGKPFDYKNNLYFKTIPKLCSAYLIKGDKDKSDKFEKLVLQSDSFNPLDIVSIAVAYKINGNEEEVNNLLNKATSKSRQGNKDYINAIFMHKLTRKYIELNELEKAEKIVLSSLESRKFDPSNAYEQLALINEAKGNIKKAIHCYRMSIKQMNPLGPRQKYLRKRLESFYRFAKRNKLDRLANEIDVQIIQTRKNDKRELGL